MFVVTVSVTVAPVFGSLHTTGTGAFVAFFLLGMLHVTLMLHA
jgi:hypothetical protein